MLSTKKKVFATQDAHFVSSAFHFKNQRLQGWYRVNLHRLFISYFGFYFIADILLEDKVFLTTFSLCSEVFRHYLTCSQCFSITLSEICCHFCHFSWHLHFKHWFLVYIWFADDVSLITLSSEPFRQ